MIGIPFVLVILYIATRVILCRYQWHRMQPIALATTGLRRLNPDLSNPKIASARAVTLANLGRHPITPSQVPVDADNGVELYALTMRGVAGAEITRRLDVAEGKATARLMVREWRGTS